MAIPALLTPSSSLCRQNIKKAVGAALVSAILFVDDGPRCSIAPAGPCSVGDGLPESRFVNDYYHDAGYVDCVDRSADFSTTGPRSASAPHLMFLLSWDSGRVCRQRRSLSSASGGDPPGWVVSRLGAGAGPVVALLSIAIRGRGGVAAALHAGQPSRCWPHAECAKLTVVSPSFCGRLFGKHWKEVAIEYRDTFSGIGRRAIDAGTCAQTMTTATQQVPGGNCRTSAARLGMKGKAGYE